jgi:hypothetical protein
MRESLPNAHAQASHPEAGAPTPEISEQLNAQRAVEAILDSMSASDTDHATLWNSKKGDWTQALSKALQEQASLTSEHVDALEPALRLALMATKRKSPEMAKIELEAAENDPEYKTFLDSLQLTQEMSRRAFMSLGERYSVTSAAPRLSFRIEQKDFAGGMRDVGTQLCKFELSEDVGERLKSLATIPLSVERYIEEIDALVETLAETMAETVELGTVDAYHGHDANGSPFDEQRDTKYRAECARLLPQMKALMDLRDAMSLNTFGEKKSPDEILALCALVDEEEARVQAPEQSTVDPHAAGRVAPGAVAAARARFEAMSGQRPVVETPTPVSEDRPQETPLSEKQVEDLLNGLRFESIEQVRSSLTPEVKRALLTRFLAKVDDRLAAARRLSPTAETLLGCKTVGAVEQGSAYEKVNTLPLVAVDGRLPSEDEVRGMSIVDYPKRAFDYDLHNDSVRSAELRMRTNMLS